MDRLRDEGGFRQEYTERSRVWSVSAGVTDVPGLSRRAGVVLSADLELAAEQMCAHLDDSLVGSGRCYLCAAHGPLDILAAGRTPGMWLVAAVQRDPATGVVSHGDWIATGDLMRTPTP